MQKGPAHPLRQPLILIELRPLHDAYQPRKIAPDSSNNSSIHSSRARQTRPTVLCRERTPGSSPGRISLSLSLSSTAMSGVITTHRNVFGVFFWFLMPLGPACAVMYRVAEYLARAWNEPEHMRNEAFGQFAARAFYWIDWIPVRLTAVAFAVVGNFEDAIYAWRNFSQRWQDEAIGIILTAGGGAMGVRLGTPAETAARVFTTPDLAVDDSDSEGDILPGEEPGARALQSTVGLVWRALLLWMLLLLLMSGAVFLG